MNIHHRLRVQKAANRWRWRCRKGQYVCHADHASTQPEALSAGLQHLATHYPRRAA